MDLDKEMQEDEDDILDEREEKLFSSKKKKVKAKGKWVTHLLKVYHYMKRKNPKTKLSDAMKVAKRSYQK